MRVDLLVPMLLASALSMSGGAWVGYNMSVLARAAFRQAPKTIPIEPAPVLGEVGTLMLRPATVRGMPHRWRAASALPSIGENGGPPTFFDFHHAYCDEAESVHGKVLRCQKLPR